MEEQRIQQRREIHAEKDFQKLSKLDMSHEILHLSFGDEKDVELVGGDGLSGVNPMDGRTSIVRYREWKDGERTEMGGEWLGGYPGGRGATEESKIWKNIEEWRKNGFSSEEPGDLSDNSIFEKTVPQPTIFEYYCSVVPTSYKRLLDELHLYQFTGNSNRITSAHMPSIYIRYHLSPVTVLYSEKRTEFRVFLVQTLGLIGGLFVVAGLVEGLIHNGLQSMQKKNHLGKFG